MSMWRSRRYSDLFPAKENSCVDSEKSEIFVSQ